MIDITRRNERDCNEKVSAVALLSLAALTAPACDKISDSMAKPETAAQDVRPIGEAVAIQERKIEVFPVYIGPPKEDKVPQIIDHTNSVNIEKTVVEKPFAKPDHLRSLPDAFDLYPQTSKTGEVTAIKFLGTDVLKGSRSGYNIDIRGHYVEGSTTLPDQGKVDFRIPLPEGAFVQGGIPLKVVIRFRDDENRPCEFNATIENLGNGIIHATANEWR